MNASAAVLLAATLAVGGCATLPPCPGQGGPMWTQWDSEHFVVLTDLGADDAKEVVRGFEEMRAAVLLAAWRRAPEPPGRLSVVVFRDDAERRVFLPSPYLGAFARYGRFGHPMIIKAGAERDDVVAHELVHAVSSQYGLLDKVEWLDEGLARYLEGMVVEGDRKLSYGKVHKPLFTAAARGRLTSFENLWHAPRPDAQLAFSATSWLAVHYLFNHEAERFGAFQRYLIEGVAPPVAWQRAFPDLDTEAMDDRLAAYVFREGEFTAFETRLPPMTIEATARPLADPEVHAVRALLFAVGGGGDPRAIAKVRSEVNEALRLDPLESVANHVQRETLHERQTDLDVPKALIARNPDDALAWFMLLQAREARHETAEAAEARDELGRLLGPRGPAPLLDRLAARPD